MFPSGFDEETGILDVPEDFPIQGCEPLSVWTGELTNGIPATITCWKPTQEEMEEIRRTGRVWLTIIGNGMPPVRVDGISPF